MENKDTVWSIRQILKGKSQHWLLRFWCVSIHSFANKYSIFKEQTLFGPIIVKSECLIVGYKISSIHKYSLWTWCYLVQRIIQMGILSNNLSSSGNSLKKCQTNLLHLVSGSNSFNTFSCRIASCLSIDTYELKDIFL